MGNTLLTTQKIACGHTDRMHLRQTLLCDRLSQPTADMVEALLVLQGLTVRIQQFADRANNGSTERAPADGSSRALMLMSTAYCILFGLQCGVDSPGGSASGRADGVEPRQPNDLLAAFERALRRPQEFLQELLVFRAQAVPKEKVMMLTPLLRDGDITPHSFTGVHGEVLRQLATYLRGAVECAQIYTEIRESAEAGRLDWAQADKLLEGNESDQRRMINAMGGGAGGYDEALYEDDISFELNAING